MMSDYTNRKGTETMRHDNATSHPKKICVELMLPCNFDVHTVSPSDLTLEGALPNTVC